MAWAQEGLESFLTERGLNRKKKKTQIVNVREGFDFLGWNIRKVDQTPDQTHNQIGTVIKRTASKKAFDRGKEIIRQCAHKHNTKDELIRHFNRRVGGWCNYYSKSSHIKPMFHDRDVFAYDRLKKWTLDHQGTKKEAYDRNSTTWKEERKWPESYRKTCNYPSFATLKEMVKDLPTNYYLKTK